MTHGKQVVLIAVLLLAGVIPPSAGNALAIGQEAETGEQDAPLKVGDRAPAISVEKLLQGPEGAELDWSALKGKTVVIEFWATWCSPCITAIPHLNELVEKFAGKEVIFISITDEEEDRIAEFLKKRPTKTWVALDPDRSTFEAYKVLSIPNTVVVDSNGNIAAVTLPENVTEVALSNLLAGESINLPPKATRGSNLNWDQEEIDWKDGVKPEFQVIIKPIKTATGGLLHRPGSNRLTADGAPLRALLQLAHETDSYHVDYRLPVSRQQYRVSVVVPKGREEILLPVFRTALEATFDVRTRWEVQGKEVLVLKMLVGSKPILSPSTAKEGEFWFMRGTIHGTKQPLERLCSVLTNSLGLPVVDETGLTGEYDWELSYQPGDDQMLINDVREKLGLELVKARRSINILVVERGASSN